eukprot:GHVU01117495.1.p1 GENE.GHVU01117495.1~~GHVU01117495.1.p1  ORF type:complete len:109 (+),score=7.93 GHVU01117495.1:650-976(+)
MLVVVVVVVVGRSRRDAEMRHHALPPDAVSLMTDQYRRNTKHKNNVSQPETWQSSANSTGEDLLTEAIGMRRAAGTAVSYLAPAAIVAHYTGRRTVGTWVNEGTGRAA